MRATEEAFNRCSALEKRILDTPAMTLAGMVAKARCHELVSVGHFADSIADDLRAIAHKHPAA